MKILFCFLFLFFYYVYSTDDMKMVKIYGKVESVDLENGIVKTNEDCVNDCFEANDCFLVYMDSNNHCLSFEFNDTERLTVIKTDKTDNLFVAFKTSILSSTECPLFDELNLIVPLGNGDPIEWEVIDNGWKFTKCVGDWKMFKRSETLIVCMQTFNVSDPITTIENAQKACDDMGGYKLTGLWSSDELGWITVRRNETEISSYQYKGYWIDGRRGAATSGIKDDVNFEFTDGYTILNKELYQTNGYLTGIDYSMNPEDCLLVSSLTGNYRMNDVVCDGTLDGYGLVCGYQLN